ncbi:MAG: helix-hairpin-helix domain-containing protein [Kineosporiaceae bacterium]
MEDHVAWFAWQSAVVILLAFLLGALVGYWFFRIQWRRVAFTESEAVTVVSRRHEKALGGKDAEIGRLRGLLAAGGSAAVATDAAVDAHSRGDVSDGHPAADAADVTADRDSTADTAVATEPDVTAGTDTTTGSDTDAASPAADGDPTENDAPAVTAVNLVDVPDPDPAGDTVVDVTDDAVGAAPGTDPVPHPDPRTDVDADSDPGAAARAFATLPTQHTDASVIDLASLENGAAADPAASVGADADPSADDHGTDASADAPADQEASPAPPRADDSAPGVPAGLVGAADDDDTVAEDDLERIEGIGPRIASALRSAGVRSFRRLADADVPTLQAALEAAGLRFAPSLPTWSRQARFLADGDEVGFIKLTESLVSGREPGTR